MAVTLVMAVIAVGCTDYDSNLGSALIPDGQGMAMGELDLKGVNRNGESIASVRLFNTTRINAANQTYGTMGLQHDEEFGMRRSGFFTQYTQASELDDDIEFGYEPFLDSMIIYLTMSTYTGDTTYVCTYEVYEVIDDSFLTNSADTIFSIDFDPFAAGALSAEPLFEFVYPDQANGVYTDDGYLMSINISETGYDLGNRLMMLDGTLDYDIYYNFDYEEFLEYFKGLYIVPKETTIGYGEGATYSIDLTASGFGFYGRGLYEEDTTIVADTIGMTYNFRNSALEDNLGGVSIQTVTRDYDQANIDYSLVKNSENLTVEATNRIFVEGMGGVVSEISFERPFFEELEQALEDGGDEYSNLFFNTAQMRIYTEMATGQETLPSGQVFTQDEIDKMNLYPTQLGLYNVYSTFDDEYEDIELELVEDYYYNSSYGASLYYGGYLNRTQGCYQLYIPLQIQDIWNDYLEAKELAGDNADNIDWDSADWNKVYLGPSTNNFFLPYYVTLQGAAGTDNVEGSETSTPIRIGLTYTLLKK